MVHISPPLKSACHSEVRYFLYSFINELAVRIRSVPATMNLLEAVMNTLCPQILKDVVEAEIVNAGIEREPVKYLVVIRDRVVPLRYERADGVILRGLDDHVAEVKLPVLTVDPLLYSG